MDPDFTKFHVEIEDVAGEVHVRPVGELDLATVPDIEAAVAEAARQDGRPPLVLDLRGLRFIDSTGIHALMQARARCKESGRGFAMIPGPPAVHRVFEMAGLADRLPFRGG